MSCCKASKACGLCVCRRGARRMGGFSLIEVLIGIVVLALGLVGLAAVFPSVVRQQQVASDQATGLSSVHSAIAALKKHAELSRPFTDAGYLDQYNLPLTYDTDEVPPTGELVGWSVLTWDSAWSVEGEWVRPTRIAAAAAARRGVNIVATTGEYVIGTQTNDFAETGPATARQQDPRNIKLGGVSIPVRDRLVPAPRPGVLDVAQPRFVWDFVARRVDLGETHRPPLGAVNVDNASSFRDDGVQVAVFVRRIDPGIRVPAGVELSDLLAPANLADPLRLPVALNGNGTPALNGVGDDPTGLSYSTIQTVDFTFATVGTVLRYDVIDLDAAAALLQYAAQVGQRFVDHLGVVHKVVEVLEGAAAGSRRVRLEAEIRRDYLSVSPAVAPNQLLFTPQVPASVEVFTIPASWGKAF